MCNFCFPASNWWANVRSAVTLAGRRRAALIVALNLAAAAIYFVHFGHAGGLGGYRNDLDVYRTGARVLLHGGDLYGRLPRLTNGSELPFTYPPFAALTFIPLTLVGYRTANWLLTALTIVSVAASLWCFAAATTGEAGARMRRLLPWALPAALLLEPVRSTLAYGQINALLMALVAVDCLTRHRLGEYCYFIGGPLSKKNRLFVDPAMHKQCAEFASKVCPFVSGQRQEYSTRPVDKNLARIAEMASAVRPEVMYILKTRTGKFNPARVNGRPMIHAGPWSRVREIS